MAATAHRTRRVNPVVLTEAVVLSKPIAPCEMIPAGIPGLVRINCKTYTLAINATLPDVGEPIVHGYQLGCTQTYKVYDIDADLVGCDCPDMLFRRGTADHPHCKHVAALRLWRAAGEIV